MIKENFLNLRLSYSQSKPQVKNSATSRNKIELSDSFLELDSSSNRVKARDQLSLLDQALDEKEICIRNGLYQNPYDEYHVYREHLEIVASLIKKHNPKIAFSLSRGINGCSRAAKEIKNSNLAQKQEQPPTVKKYSRENFAQTINPPEKSLTPDTAEDYNLLKALNEKLDGINFTKVTRKLKDLHKSLKKARTDIPDLSKIPDLSTYDVHETIKSIENHIKSISKDISTEISKKKVQSLSKSLSTQTEMKIIEQHVYNALEKLAIKKEEEIFNWKKKFEILSIDHERLSQRFDEVQSNFNEAQRYLVKYREQAAKVECSEKGAMSRIEIVNAKIVRKKEKIKFLRRENAEFVKKINKQRLREKDLCLAIKNLCIKSGILENKISQIEKSWKTQTGKEFVYKNVNINHIINNLGLPDFDKAEITEQDFEILAKEANKLEKFIEKAQENTKVEKNTNKDPEKGEDAFKNKTRYTRSATKTFLNNTHGANRIKKLTVQETIDLVEENPSSDQPEDAFNDKKDSLNVFNNKSDILNSTYQVSSVLNSLDHEKTNKIQSKLLKKTNRNIEDAKKNSDKDEIQSKILKNLQETIEENKKSSIDPDIYAQILRNPELLSKITNTDSLDLFLNNPDPLENFIAPNKSLGPETKLASQKPDKGKTIGLNQLKKANHSSNSSDLKVSERNSTNFSESSSFSSNNKMVQDYESMASSLDPSSKTFEKYQKIPAELRQSTQTEELIPEDPEEYLMNTYSLFNLKDKLHSKILEEFPNVHKIPKQYQIEIFKIMKEHEKNQCTGICKHLARVQQLKYKTKGIPYPIKTRNVELVKISQRN